MREIILEFIFGLLSGLFLGVTGIAPTGLLLLIFEYFKIGDYTSNLGALLFLNLFPISIGSVWDFYKAGKINYSMGWVVLLSIIIGSFISSKYVVGNKINLSKKTLKYITSLLGFFIFVLFFISALYEKN
jgi:uncharacterized membrane protein YfcA